MAMQEHIAHSGAWGLALIVIVVASWFLYRYLAPKTWKEWAGAGMSKLEVMAAFSYNNMPKGDPHLTKEQALDAAAYVINQPRPKFTKDSEVW